MRHRLVRRSLAALLAASGAVLSWPAHDALAQDTMTFAQFAAQVEANHPVALQARLIGAQARATVQEGKGAFDPKFAFSVAQKAYKGEQYYTYLDAGFKVPTPIGADLKLGFERTAGSKVSADRATPANGLVSLGMSIPLGQRLITDERRTALSVARAMGQIGEAEQQGMINKLLLDAAKAYGGWYAASQRFAIATDGVRLARFRFDAVVQRVLNGESPAIDTLEASLEVQRRAVTLAETETELRAAQFIAEAFLWDARSAPVRLAAGVRPVLEGLERTEVDTTRLVSWIEAVAVTHPELRKAEGKLQAANAERLLAWQAQIPFVEASVAAIGERGQQSLLGSSEQWNDNYKASLDIETSLLFLKERGKSSRGDQKLEFARLDRDRLRRDLAYGVRIALNDVVLLERVLGAQRTNVRIATQLRDAEQVRFLNGESTLLVVNLRERLVLDEAGKLAALEGKLAAARAALVVAVGVPALVP